MTDHPIRDPFVMETLSSEFREHAAVLPTVLEFLDAGVPLPFLARYRKERTGGLSETVLRRIRDRRDELEEIGKRRRQALRELELAGLSSAETRRRVERTRSVAALEDVRDFCRDLLKDPERAAEEETFGPLASAILRGEAGLSLEELAAPFVSQERGIPDGKAALDGALRVIARRMGANLEAFFRVRSHLLSAGRLRARLVPDGDVHSKYKMVHDFSEPVRSVAGQRVLAVLRGGREKALTVGIEADRGKAVDLLREMFLPPEEHPYRELFPGLVENVHDEVLRPRAERSVLRHLKEKADREAVKVFSGNLEQLLLTPPAGERVVMGVHPGIRRGVKLAVVDAEGNHVAHATIFPFPPKNRTEAAKKTVGDFCRHHKVELVAVGTGAGSRETERFFRSALGEDDGVQAKVVLVNDAGSSAYASGHLAKREFPKLDMRARCAVTIARRLQDPLGELAKVEPRAIGVGPYQRDVDQALLNRALREIIRSVVARVGVDPNRADLSLLSYVPGFSARIAEAVMARRSEKGPFGRREELREVPGVDERVWLFAAGFLRIRGGENPLDATGIHPEHYRLVEEMAARLDLEPAALLGNGDALSGLDPSGFAGEEIGLPTVLDIFRELREAGRDPRGHFEPPSFREDLRTLEDLRPGMELEGIVTNIAGFGVFVDVGIEQEGLVHVSQLADGFVKDPGHVTAVGRRVKVRVIGVDRERKRFSLSMRPPGTARPRRREESGRPGDRRGRGGERRGRAGERGGRPPAGRRPEKGRGGGKGRTGRRPGRPGGPRSEEGRRSGPPGKDRPRVIEQKAKREPEPEIDPSLPEEELYRLKLERLRKRFEQGT